MGQTVALNTTRFGGSPAKSVFDYARHGKTPVTEFDGRANIAFADGHAEMVNAKDLVTGDGLSTLKVMWSPKDRSITNP